MKSLISLALICLPAVAFAQADVPPAADQEILRRGSLVEHVGVGISDDSAAIAEAMRPPADDSHKWFISIISTPNCRYCTQLERDFSTSSYLLAFANPHDYKTSWSHYNIYRSNDATQTWRFKKLKLVGYPTLVVQPPRSGEFGDPATVVWQKTGYDGDPKKLAAGLRAAISNYAVRQHQIRQSTSEENEEDTGEASGTQNIVPSVTGGFEQATSEPQETADEESVGNGQRQPPFTPPARVDPAPYYPPNQPPQFPFEFPPQPDLPQIDVLSLVGTLLGRITGGNTTTNLLLTVLAGLAGMRTFRRRPAAAELSTVSETAAAKRTRTTK